MSDLVKRLRAQRPEDRQVYWRNAELRQVIPIMDEAADALERAEQDAARLREKLEAALDALNDDDAQGAHLILYSAMKGKK